MAFRDRAGGGGGLDGVPGFMIKQPGTPHSTQLPDWKTFTEIRIFPAPREGGWEPMRNSIEFDHFGPAVETEPVAKKLGAFESFTYITRIPELDGEDPTTKLTNALLTVAEHSPHDIPKEWYGWTQSGPGRGAKVSKVQTHMFAQAAATAIKGKPCKNRVTGKEEPRFPVLFMGSLSILMAFSRLGNAQVEGFEFPAQLPPTDTEEGRRAFDELCARGFKLGDWCSPEHGRIMKIFQAEKTETEIAHYDIEMLAEKPLNEAMQNRVRSFWTPWPQLFRYHTAEQQIGYLKRAFPVELLDFALGRSEYEGMLPEGTCGSWQALQNSMRGGVRQAYATGGGGGLQGAAQQQLQQSQTQQAPPQTQQTQQAPPQTQQAPPADDGWGSGDGGDEETPSGPEVPATPSEFSAPAGQQPQTQQTPQSPNAAPHTPGPAVTGGAVDPALLAQALTMLNDAKNKGETPGNAGQ